MDAINRAPTNVSFGCLLYYSENPVNSGSDNINANPVRLGVVVGVYPTKLLDITITDSLLKSL